jgi:hypothetical protein
VVIFAVWKIPQQHLAPLKAKNSARATEPAATRPSQAGARWQPSGPAACPNGPERCVVAWISYVRGGRRDGRGPRWGRSGQYSREPGRSLWGAPPSLSAAAPDAARPEAGLQAIAVPPESMAGREDDGERRLCRTLAPEGTIEPTPTAAGNRPTPLLPKVILMGKSEIRTMSLWHRPEKQVSQHSSSYKTDFASSITVGEMKRWRLKHLKVLSGFGRRLSQAHKSPSARLRKGF